MGKPRIVKKYFSRHRGQQSSKYRVEVVPHSVDGLPENVSHVSFKFQRGQKLAETDPAPVSEQTGSAQWPNTKLHQVATMYIQPDNTLVPKDFSFKLKSIVKKHGETKRKTIGSCQMDLTKLCIPGQPLVERNVTLQLSPAGSVRATISLLWLKSSSSMGDYDDVGSEVSFMSSEADLNVSSETDELSSSKLSTSQALGTSGRRHSTPGSIFKDLSNSDVGSVTPAKSFEGGQKEATREQRRQSAIGILSATTGGAQERRDAKERKAKTLTWAPSPNMDRTRSKSQDSQFFSPPDAKAGAGADVSGSSSEGGRTCERAGEEARGCRSEEGGAEVNPHKERFERKYRSLARFSAEPSPTKSPVDKEHYLEMLASSDDEDDAGKGGPMTPWRNRLKGFFSGPSSATRPEQQQQQQQDEGGTGGSGHRTRSSGAERATGAAACSVTLQMIEAESDVGALRALAAKAVLEQGEASAGRRRMENTACRLRAQLEAAEMVSGSLKERLQELVETQQRQHKDGDLTADLIQSKVKLADTEFSALQLQGELNMERERTRHLMAKLTKLETRYHMDREAHFSSSPAKPKSSAFSRFGSNFDFNKWSHQYKHSLGDGG